jgi:hypothetical protein
MANITETINHLAQGIENFRPHEDAEWFQIEERECSLIVSLEYFLDIARQLNDSDNYVIADDETNMVAYIVPEIHEVINAHEEAFNENDPEFDLGDGLIFIKVAVTTILTAFADRKNCFDETIADFLAIDADNRDL